MYRILVCDDEKDIVSALKIYLMADGYHYDAGDGWHHSNVENP